MVWRLPYTSWLLLWLLGTAGDTSPQNMFAYQRSLAQSKSGGDVGGGCVCVCLRCFYTHPCTAQVNEQRLVGCIFHLVGSWLALFGLLFCWIEFWFLCLFLLPAELLRLCSVKLNAKLGMPLQNNWLCLEIQQRQSPVLCKFNTVFLFHINTFKTKQALCHHSQHQCKHRICSSISLTLWW